MKNILLITILFLSQQYFSQEYPLNTSPSDIPNNAYIKDINNELDKFVGLWKGNWNGKTVYLELRKIKSYSSVPGDTHPYYFDEIQGERKIIDSNGNVEIDRISNFGSDGAEFSGMSKSIKPPGRDRLTFYPRNMCRKMATLDITNFSTNQMTLHFEYLPSHIDESCTYYNSVMQGNDFPINFPKDIVLTKQ